MQDNTGNETTKGGLAMDWYEKLNDYFPEHEMKNQQQLQALITENEMYHKEQTEDYIVLYAEFPDFIFLDYLLVISKARGKGIGSKLLDRFKEKGKIMLLEAEPERNEDPDSRRRMSFYLKNGFKKADRIQYQREDDEGQTFIMNILYWPARELSQQKIMDTMIKACREVHNYRSKDYYGRILADPDKALQWKKH